MSTHTKLDTNNFKDYLSLLEIISSKEKIEKDVFDEKKLKDLNIFIHELKKKLNEISDETKIYENKYEFISNKIPNELSIGEMYSVIYLLIINLILI